MPCELASTNFDTNPDRGALSYILGTKRKIKGLFSCQIITSRATLLKALLNVKGGCRFEVGGTVRSDGRNLSESESESRRVRSANSLSANQSVH